eukprot:GEMP01039986.1.p1 GENE.GEMP01039986.1~~GEMP01039986.1.p1  ORF type:complete len:197 (+),score=56.84 GEMP01039986.1:58-648(+)
MEKLEGVTYIEHFFNLKYAAIKREATKNARRLAHEKNRCILCTLPRPCKHGHDENAHRIVPALLSMASSSHSLSAPSPQAHTESTGPEGPTQRRLTAWKLKKAKELNEMEVREKNDVLAQKRAWKKHKEQTSARLRTLRNTKFADVAPADAGASLTFNVESEKKRSDETTHGGEAGWAERMINRTDDGKTEEKSGT